LNKVRSARFEFEPHISLLANNLENFLRIA